MNDNATVCHAARLLGEVLEQGKGMEQACKDYFKAHPKLGARDRAGVRDVVYGCLRRLRSLDYWLEQVGLPDASGETGGRVLMEARVRAWMTVCGRGHPVGAGQLGLDSEPRTLDSTAYPPRVRSELPDWLYRDLVAQLGEAETLDLAAALNRPAPLDLRVNSLASNRKRTLQRLHEEGCEAVATPWSPFGVRIPAGTKLSALATFRDGWVEPQDEGSQLLAPLLEPRRGELVVDLCAGAGGKTLHLGALMAGRGMLYAFDIAAKRLQRLAPRLQRAGLRNVRITQLGDLAARPLAVLAGKVDRVLVDAPCSGTGTLRRRPEVRWQAHGLKTCRVQLGDPGTCRVQLGDPGTCRVQLGEPGDGMLSAVQDRVLDAAARLLKPGGRLVYATCSLVREENEDRIEAFLARHGGFRLLPLAPILTRRKIPLQTDPDQVYLHTYPHRHGTDAFFAAVLEKGGEWL